MNSFKIIARNRGNKQGLLPLYAVSTCNRKRAFKSLNVLVLPKNWDSKNQKFKNVTADSLFIEEIKHKAKTQLLKLSLEQKIICQKQFLKLIFNYADHKTDTDFFDFIDLFIKQKNYPVKHQKSYDTLKEQLKAFNPRIYFSDINYSFCMAFASYLQVTHKNSNNTRLKKIQYLRCILSEAQKHGLIKENPATQVKIKSEKTNRQALSKADLLKLENLFLSNQLTPGAQNVLKYFLFCCYTGLRFSDLVSFTINDIHNGVIKIKQHKTGGYVAIPLIDKAKYLLPDYKFSVLSNQKSNSHLKTIKNLLHIKVNITCHVARHTFATIGLNSGISLEVVSEVLGHSNTRVTKIYAKMLDDFKVNELKKWGL